jgi:LCP family protein required for cell wall assembly
LSPDEPENPETPDSSEPTGPAAGPPPALPIPATPTPADTPAPADGAVPAKAADDAAVMTEPPKSRADLQAQLRKSKKKDRKRKHRWRRRILYTCAALIVLIAAGAGGIYVYANYRYDQIKKVHSKHLVAQPADPLKPFNLLLVGSDSRAFVDNSTQVRAFGNDADAGGQRSDVTMVARFDPANKTVTVLSIPRDLWVDIPGNVPNISGMNRINAAYNSGPDLLVQTIEQVLGIPVNHYASVGFDGFSGMVNALGGITMDFPTPVKDQYTGLYVTQTGCQVVNGTTALQLVRSRHLYYMNSHGYWEYDGESDFSRIQRQDAFFRAVLAKINTSITNPLAINSFIGASVGNVTIDDTLTQSDLLHIAEFFRGLPSSHLITETLPTTSLVTDGGADVLQEAQPYAQNMINAFNAIGTTPATTTTTTAPQGTKGKSKGTTTTTAPAVPHGDVSVNVLNASTVNGIAHDTATALTNAGFKVAEIGNASQLTEGSDSEILYGPTGYGAALSLGATLSGPLTYRPDSDLSGNTVSLLIAGSSLSVTGSSSGSSSTTSTSTTSTTYPGETTTTTTIPSDVYTNTELEPWNPYPCTLGAPATTTTAPAKKASKK